MNQALIPDQKKYVGLVAEISLVVKCPYELHALNLEWFTRYRLLRMGARHSDVAMPALPSR
jgi:hypothetical protein